MLVYVGFPDMPKGFDELLFAELDRIGAISAYREDAELSRADAWISTPPVRTLPHLVDREPARVPRLLALALRAAVSPTHSPRDADRTRRAALNRSPFHRFGVA